MLQREGSNSSWYIAVSIKTYNWLVPFFFYSINYCKKPSKRKKAFVTKLKRMIINFYISTFFT